MRNRLRNQRLIKPQGIIIALLLWILVGFILYPTLQTLFVSLQNQGDFSFHNYSQIIETASHRMALKNTLLLGVFTVIICGVIGTALAFLVHFFELPFKKIIDKLLLLPIVLPGLIIVFAFVQLYGESGLVTKTIQTAFGLQQVPFHFSGLAGILVVHAYTQYVYFYMNVSIAIKHIDQSTLEAGGNLGASRFQIFKTVILPFIKPALIASSIITFMTGVGSFSAPSIIGGSYKVLTTQILLAKANNFMGLAAAQVILLTMISMVYLAVFRFYENKIQFTSSVKGVAIHSIQIQNKAVKNLLVLFLIVLVVIIILPVITIFFLSFVKPGTWMIDIYPRAFSLDNYIKIFSKSRALAPFINSIVMSVMTAILCMAVALPSSYIIVKTNSKLKVIFEFLVMLPWAIPSSAIAINMINAFNRPSIFTGKYILVGTSVLLPLAYFVSLLPLMARTTTISLQNLNDTYLEASKSLGATSRQTFKHVVLPIVAPGLLAGLLFIVIRSIGEYTLSAFLYTPSNKPIAIAMVNGIFEYDIGLAMAYGALVVIVAFIGSLIIGKIQAY